MIALGILAAVCSNLAHRMQHRRVITSAKQLTYFRQTFLCQFFRQIHRNLARAGVVYADLGDPPMLETGLAWRREDETPTLRQFLELAQGA